MCEFKGKDGSTTTIREHSLGHKLDNHGPRFNSEVRSSTGIKQPLGGNGDSHTYFN
ncbi:HNH/endonuclease VII fold putative polymorphic toxin [Motiliproteus sp. MSK22-1]|uniref:HNH/endonuclease VII fold putative polymorphic toxin n=1 Tax=Motiliproteus sp. MSK22-1 TaxID=1897630 RepID=UPI0035161902